MYEHFRNSLQFELMNNYSIEDIEKILKSLDKVAFDYEVSEKETSLIVVNNEIPKLVKIYLSSKKLEGLSDITIKLYANILRIFFQEFCKHHKDIETNEIR